MIRQNSELVLFSTDVEQVAALRDRFASDPHISVVCGNGVEVSQRCKLDALWVSPMQASYFGIASPLPPHVARVFPMPPERREKGLPRLLIAGVTLVPGKAYTSKYLAGIGAQALAKVVAQYNSEHDFPIHRIGSNPGNLGLDDLGASESFRAVRQVFAASQVPALASHPLAKKQFA